MIGLHPGGAFLKTHAEMEWRCPLCKKAIHGNMAKASHYKNLWKSKDDASRCDRPVPLVTAPAAVVEIAPVAVATAPVAVAMAPVPVVTAPSAVGLHELARRPALSVKMQHDQRSAYTIPQYNGVVQAGVRDMLYIQDEYDAYRRNVTNQCSPQFWMFFLSLHSCTGVAIDSALHAARRIFLTPKSDAWKMFPHNKRALFTRIRKVPWFWNHVMHTVNIDVSAFEIPSGIAKITFEFIDPIWAWLVAARRQNPADLHWKNIDPGEVPEYGAGVQYGEAFHEACKSCPPKSYPMCFSLHWDGTHGHGLQAAPICVGVANTNCQRSDSHYCIAYMPQTPDARRLTPVLVMCTYVCMYA